MYQKIGETKGTENVDFEYDPKMDFERHWCNRCKHRNLCPADWLCKKGREHMRHVYENLDYDNSL